MKLTGQSKFNQFYGDGKPSEFQNFRGFKNRKKNKWTDYCYASVKSKAIYSSIFKEMSGI